jgi:hypothetical protein
MSWKKPEPSEVWRAVGAYLSLAYDDQLPAIVASRLQALRACSEADFYRSSVFELDSGTEPSRYALRLGYRFYPHVKLVIERAPNGTGALFQADTHDRHCCPEPSSPDYSRFRELMDQNQRFASAVEAAWARDGLPTFKQFLRRDIELRARAN